MLVAGEVRTGGKQLDEDVLGDVLGILLGAHLAEGYQIDGPPEAVHGVA